MKKLLLPFALGLALMMGASAIHAEDPMADQTAMPVKKKHKRHHKKGMKKKHKKKAVEAPKPVETTEPMDTAPVQQ